MRSLSGLTGTAVTKDLSAVGAPTRAWKSNSLGPFGGGKVNTATSEVPEAYLYIAACCNSH